MNPNLSDRTALQGVAVSVADSNVFKLSVFCPTEEDRQRVARSRIRDLLILNAGGVTEYRHEGAWRDPNGNLCREDGTTIVALIGPAEGVEGVEQWPNALARTNGLARRCAEILIDQGETMALVSINVVRSFSLTRKD